MKIEVKPTQDTEKLRENLEKRVEEVKISENKLEVEIEEEKLEMLERTPGIEYYTKEGEKVEGLKGRPVQEKAVAEIEDEKDLAEAAVATIEGYDLTILNSSKRWDLKLLRRLNPKIVNLKQDTIPDFLDIEKTMKEDSSREKIDIDLDEDEVKKVNSFLEY